jgi:hypothetical protein
VTGKGTKKEEGKKLKEGERKSRGDRRNSGTEGLNPCSRDHAK